MMALNDKHICSTFVSAKTIFDLPQSFMLNVFDNLSLIDLLRIDEVCQLWKNLKSKALFKREHLILIPNKDYLASFSLSIFSPHLLYFVKNDDGSPYCKIKNLFEFNVLYFKMISPLQIDMITELMPNINVLFIVHDNCQYIELLKIKFLLHHFSENIKKLYIVLSKPEITYTCLEEKNAFETYNEIMLVSLTKTINNMLKLTSLILDYQFSVNLKTFSEINLNVVRYLDEFGVFIKNSFYQPNHTLHNTYMQHVKKNKKLKLYSKNVFQLNSLVDFSPRVAKTFRAVSIQLSSFPLIYKTLKQFSQKFCNIEKLTINFSELSISKIVESLVFSKNLVHLTISTQILQQQNFKSFNIKNIIFKNKQQLTLDSLKSLSIYINTTSHKNLEKMNLHKFFPNVQVIELAQKFDGCNKCMFAIPENIEKKSTQVQLFYSSQVHKCMRLARIPFEKFEKLSLFIANIDVEPINLFFTQNIHFTRQTLSMETFDYIK